MKVFLEIELQVIRVYKLLSYHISEHIILNKNSLDTFRQNASQAQENHRAAVVVAQNSQ